MAYRLAGQTVIANVCLPGMEGLEIGRAEHSEAAAAMAAVTTAVPGLTTFEGGVQIGNGRPFLRVVRLADRLLVDLDGLPEFAVSTSTGAIESLGALPEDPTRSAVEGFLGPVMLTALALRGTFCLHASAVRCGQRVVALAGESGAGKSTLARELERASDGRWQRVADDLLPFTASDAGVRVHPDYPQLKLPAEQQPWRELRDELKLASLWIVQPLPARHAEPVVPIELTPFACAAAVAAHTVAARLFDPDLLASHLEACRQVASRTPVRALRYPHRAEAVREVLELIDRELG